jgi:ABC-type Mn2+/Zn2+ transport system ATPase subunit
MQVRGYSKLIPARAGISLSGLKTWPACIFRTYLVGGVPLPMSENIIAQVKCLRHVYPDQTEVDLCGLDFSVCTGQRIAILGANGSGKSTLIFHLLGLLAPVDGDVTVFGVNPSRQFKEIRHRIGVVLQNVDDQIIGPTVWDDVTFTPRALGWPQSEVERPRAKPSSTGWEYPT